MRILSRSDRRGVSNVVAYVLLIAITVALSVMVYAWLKFYVQGGEIEECSEGVSLIVKDYNCYKGDTGRLIITLKNKGRFSVDGFVLRVHDRVGADFGFYTLDSVGAPIVPGGEYSTAYFFNDTYDFSSTKNLTTLTFVEVQPYITKSENISCKSYASQEISCL